MLQNLFYTLLSLVFMYIIYKLIHYFINKVMYGGWILTEKEKENSYYTIILFKFDNFNDIDFEISDNEGIKNTLKLSSIDKHYFYIRTGNDIIVPLDINQYTILLLKIVYYIYLHFLVKRLSKIIYKPFKSVIIIKIKNKKPNKIYTDIKYKHMMLQKGVRKIN